MSTLQDETAADLPVRDLSFNPQSPAGQQDSPALQISRAPKFILQMSKKELEDQYLMLHEETLQLKQHIATQDDKIKKLGTKLMRMVKDRSRMEQLATGSNRQVSRVRDLEMEEMVEELQETVRGLQADNERLKQRLLLAKQQLFNTQSRRPTPYDHVQPRVNSGLKKLQDDASCTSAVRPKSARSLPAAGRLPTGLQPRYGHSLLEEARAEIRNLENMIKNQQSHTEELERANELLLDELKQKEVEYEERLLEVRQHQTTKMRSHVVNNVAMVKLQKQLADRSNTVTELEGRFLQFQESQRSLKASHDAAMAKVDELSAKLKEERWRNSELATRIPSSAAVNLTVKQLQDRVGELEQEREELKQHNDRLVSSACDVSREKKWQIQEQQLRVKIGQLETALNADLTDKQEILDKIRAEKDINERLKEESQKLQMQFLHQKQKMEELNDRLRFYSREEYDMAELTEALLLVKKRKSQRSGDLGFLNEVQDEGTVRLQELQATHIETIQELQKTRNLLSIESKISKDYKVELEAVVKKWNSERVENEQKLERLTKLLDAKEAKITKMEVQFKNLAYGARTYAFQPDLTDGDESDEFDESFHLERSENLLEFKIVGATLSPSALELLGDGEPSTFCTFSFYLFELHSTPVVTGQKPKYDFTSKYVVNMDDHFFDYIHTGSVTLELHQALDLSWRTMAVGQIQLQQLLEDHGSVQGTVPSVHGTVPLVGTSGEGAWSFGSLDYTLRLRIPVAETIRRYRDKVKAVGYVHSNPSTQAPQSLSGWNELHIMVQRCRGLRSRSSQKPSPYVVYKFSEFPEHPTATVHDCCDPCFNDLKSYSVLLGADLDRSLRSDVLHFYVFNCKEEKKDEYVGKAAVPLLPLAEDREVSGAFQLTDPVGLLSGHIEVTLKWKFSYRPPSESIMTAGNPVFIPAVETRVEDEKKDRQEEEEEPPVPKVRRKTLLKEEPASKNVRFVDQMLADDKHQEEDGSSSGVTGSSLSPDVKHLLIPTTEEEDDVSPLSEGQLLPVSQQTDSDDSEISEKILEDTEETHLAGPDPSESTQSDSDDCIVQGPAAWRKRCERLRVEVLSLSLRPGGRVARDSSVSRLFVEYSLLDVDTQETPLSLPKPPQGKSINYNYSKVFPLDAENHSTRRRLLREVLQGRRPQMERIRFTVVSEPPEEEQQDGQCEDVGVAFLRIPDILEEQRDLMETTLNVVDVEDSSKVVGSLTVSVEGLEALLDIMADEDQEKTPSSISS